MFRWLRGAFRALHTSAQRGKVKGQLMDYIISIKPDGNATLFDQMHQYFLTQECTEIEESLNDGASHGYRFANGL